MSNKAEIIKRPVEQAGSNIKKTAWSAMLESLILITLGILCVVLPNTIINIVALVIGVFFVVRGALSILDYYMNNRQSEGFNAQLMGGIISVLLGIVAFVMGQDIARVISIIIGIVIIYEALLRMSKAVKLHSAGLNTWQPVAVVSIIMFIIGVFVTFGSGGAVPLMGWMMILSGVISIVGDVIFIKYVNEIVDKLTGKTEKKTTKK